MRQAALALAVSCAVPLLAGCPEKKTVVVDAAPPPVAPAVEDAGPTVLVPMDDDAGSDAGVDAGKKAMGPMPNQNVARLKQCCTALGTQAKSMGASPEAGMLAGLAAQCTAVAAQAGPTGTAPELGAFRAMLAGKNVPAVCSGL